ncbi:MAG: VPGUxxT family thioredoxin-like (seleno)protein, type 2 [Bacteroidota bacterium]
MKKSKIMLPLLALFIAVQLTAKHGQPKELGQIRWTRNFEEGLAQAAKVNKPVFLLFQEVPGCSTCRNYGQHVLSHPLIAEAIETLFVPVAIFNNKGGEDAKVLKYYGEPSWNNPVVRIVNAQKENIIDRLNGNYSRLGIVQAMRLALQTENLEVPPYLSLLEEELLAAQSGSETAIFSMFCFWTGEKELGKIDGVVETQAGFMNGREVVSVKYDPAVIPYKKLLQSANQASCADHAYTDEKAQSNTAAAVLGKEKVATTGQFRADREPKYYLGKTMYRFVPMTQLQALKVNSLIGQRQVPDAILSPRQLALLKYIRANPNGQWKNQINVDFVEAWKEVVDKKKA